MGLEHEISHWCLVVFCILKPPFTIEFLQSECRSSKNPDDQKGHWWCLYIDWCYVLTPCPLLHQLLLLCILLIHSLLVLQHHCSNWDVFLPPTEREEPDDSKPSADIQTEYCYDYLYSPSIGAVTKNSCKNFGKCRYCWVIRMLDNLVPVCSIRCQVNRILHYQNSHFHHYLNDEVPHTFLLAVNTTPCYISQHYARYYCTVTVLVPST
jgi:hypothetical protein